MRIGLLAYHAACNFGAFLQLLSTVEYIKKQGDEPRVINWIPRDFAKECEKKSKIEVRRLYADLREQYYPLTKLCETDSEVAKVIEEEHIEVVIIGSDAVIQHHPLRTRIYFPCKRIIYIAHASSDRNYPNCFWGSFKKYLKQSIPVAVISGSSQDTKFYYIKGKLKKKMKQTILDFNYLSVRDDWTQKMISFLTDGEFIPEVTPDPVFAFNQNAGYLLPSKKDIIKKFNIPEDYVILSFKANGSVNQNWIDEFQIAAKTKGLACVKLPYADAAAFGDVEYSVGDSITPLEWFALIKYSKGYVGNNMHPIVSSIANGVPFFSFDNYGIADINGKPTNGESSKIFHILKTSGLLTQRVFIKQIDYCPPQPEVVLNSIANFDYSKEKIFAEHYYQRYISMMNSVYSSLRN